MDEEQGLPARERLPVSLLRPWKAPAPQRLSSSMNSGAAEVSSHTSGVLLVSSVQASVAPLRRRTLAEDDPQACGLAPASPGKQA
jgi:hypothetical protein